jgi:spermidine/putrescine transport system ATP-binding protein
VFHSYALFPHMTILENVAFGLKRRGIKDADPLAHEALRLVELDHVGGRKPTQLSGGQQQRVALARAIVNRPALLLLDEPLGALDLKLRRQMQVELKDIQSDVGLTFLHVTHDQEEAMTMADTVAVMNKGRIEQMGAPQELYELPHTSFVAKFLGQSNLFSGEIISSSSTSMVIDAAGTKVEVLLDRARRHSGHVTVGVRPEKVSLHDEEPTADSARTAMGPGRITDVSFSGVSTQYEVTMAQHGAITVFAQNTSISTLHRDGDEVWLSWAVNHAFGLADEADGEPVSRFHTDLDTSMIAVQSRKNLEAELEGA